MADDPLLRHGEFVTIFESGAHDAETEAEMVHGLLESAGVESMIVRENVQELPTGKVGVRVLEPDAAAARRIIEDAKRNAAGAE